MALTIRIQIAIVQMEVIFAMTSMVKRYAVVMKSHAVPPVGPVLSYARKFLFLPVKFMCEF